MTMAIVGAGFGYATMSNFLTTQSFPIGLALISVFLILLGVFSGFTAIMLHSLNAHLDDRYKIFLIEYICGGYKGVTKPLSYTSLSNGLSWKETNTII